MLVAALRPHCGRERKDTRENTDRWWGYRDAGHRRARVAYRGQRISEISLARRKSGVQIPSPPPHKRPGHRPSGSPPPGRRRSRSPCRAANGQQPRRKRPRCWIAARLRSQAEQVPIFRLRDGCSASIWSASDGSSLLTLGASSVQTAPDGSRRIVWMIKWMIKTHPIGSRMPRQGGARLTHCVRCIAAVGA